MLVRLLGAALLLAARLDERLVDVRQNTTTGNGGADETVELLVAADGELQVARLDTLHLQVLAGVACRVEKEEEGQKFGQTMC